jgi:hydroxycarboxylate dehydrogenase B
VDEPTRGGILNSMLATVIDLSRLGDPGAIARNIEATKSHIRTSRLAPGFDEVLLPGEPERRAARQRAEAGVEVDATTWREIREAAGTLGIAASEIDQAVGAN